jgi:hypothetical protein
MYAQVSLETELHRNVLTLPVPSIGTDSDGKFVYAVQQGRISRLPVQIGMTEGGIAELLGGVADNVDVVMSVQGSPPPGTTVKAVPHA